MKSDWTNADNPNRKMSIPTYLPKYASCVYCGKTVKVHGKVPRLVCESCEGNGIR